ncbi:MAG: phenylacetate-CoA oxygenase subunit PaaJ [Flavobacteriales bacterium]|nr:MAG: phenylacetate-CoA oxygenase subunit PaaJ [Flavobacteriales bacterium]
MAITKEIDSKIIWDLLAAIPDPEIPVINIVELGVVRNVKVANESVEVVITPTYSGCPAMQMIEDDIKEHLKLKGCQNVKVTTVLSPAWTTDWIPEEAREKLKEYGIAPPEKPTSDFDALIGKPKECPQCGSSKTELKSQFGSTPCKSLYVCTDCKEPFDYFKCH